MLVVSWLKSEAPGSAVPLFSSLAREVAQVVLVGYCDGESNLNLICKSLLFVFSRYYHGWLSGSDSYTAGTRSGLVVGRWGTEKGIAN